MARSKPAAAVGNGPAGAFAPAPDTAPEEVAEGEAPGPDQAVQHAVVHRPRAAAAPYQP